MKVLSLIVPAYNSEKFLDKGIPSFFAEEILDKLDIIIVNDGSSDGTAAAAEKYCRMYPNSIRLINQENKGHGGALNTGFDAAVGKFLKPIDSDDWVQTQNLPALIDALEKTESDVVLTHYRTIDISSGEICNFRTHPEVFGKELTMEQVVENFRSFFRVLTFHGIAYRREFYREKGIRLSEHVFYEDNEYATFPCCHAQSVLPLDLYLYEYRIGDVNQSVSLANQLKRQSHTQTVIRRMTEEYEKLPDGAGKRYAALKTQGLVLNYLMTALLVDPDRKEGRRQSAKAMNACRKNPEIYGMVKRKYQVYCLLSALHVTKPQWDAVLKSRLYNRLRGNPEA